MRTHNILLWAVFLFALSTSVSDAGWLVYHKPEFKGRVIDAETKAPIEGAVVVVTYSKTTHFLPEAQSSIIDVRETLTDKNGEFHIPSYTTMIQPLSTVSMANFIIFKPGYGTFPNHQKSPAGIRPMDEEIFFSSAVGSEGDMELWVKGEKVPDLIKSKVTFGVVELPKLKTREEIEKRMLGFPTDFGPKELPQLYKAYEEEKRLFIPGGKK